MIDTEIKQKTEKIEALAAYSHGAWSGWMKYMLEKGVKYPNGDWHMPPELYERWTRQMNTPYAELPEQEKDSDRVEAHTILATLDNLGVGK